MVATAVKGVRTTGGKKMTVTQQDLRKAGVSSAALEKDNVSQATAKNLGKAMAENRGLNKPVRLQKSSLSKADRQNMAARAGFGRSKSLLSSADQKRLTELKKSQARFKSLGQKDLARRASREAAGLRRSATSKEFNRRADQGIRLRNADLPGQNR